VPGGNVVPAAECSRPSAGGRKLGARVNTRRPEAAESSLRVTFVSRSPSPAMAASAASEDSRTHIRNAADDINLQTVKDGAGINDPVTFSTRRHLSAKEWHIIIVKTKLDIWQVQATQHCCGSSGINGQLMTRSSSFANL
jgi:hypothetical protein